jgi:hypothetical protein
VLVAANDQWTAILMRVEDSPISAASKTEANHDENADLREGGWQRVTR